MKEKIVCIEWEDASFNSGWYDKKKPEEFEPILTRTVGYLIKATNKAILVAFERSYNLEKRPPDDRHIGTIPKKMIKKITYLKE